MLERISRICATLPEVSCERHGSHATFRVKKKPFAYFLANHHDDGITAIACKTEPGENTALAHADPDRYYLPAYIGPRGWVALRLDLGPGSGGGRINSLPPVPAPSLTPHTRLAHSILTPTRPGVGPGTQELATPRPGARVAKRARSAGDSRLRSCALPPGT